MASTLEQRQANGAGPAEEDAPDVPDCLSWTEHQVADWIEELGFREYRVNNRPLACQ